MSKPAPNHPVLIEIVEQSASFYERMNPDHFVPVNRKTQEEVETIMKTWRESVGRGLDTRLDNRLQFDGLTATTVRQLAAGVRLRDSAHLPPWSDCLDAVLWALSNNHDTAPTLEQLETLYPSLQNVAGQRGFEHALTPFVGFARTQVAESIGRLGSRISASAVHELEHLLFHALVSVSREVFYAEFSVYRSTRNKAGTADEDPARDYRGFLAKLFTGGMVQQFRRYPVIARLLAQVTVFWIQFVQAFLARLESDWDDLQELAPGRLGSIESLQTSLSDRHRKGATVIGICFTSGAKWYYKPRSLAAEKAFNGILDWINQSGISTPFQKLTGLFREGYGWLEHVPASDCDSEEAVERFYKRCGMLVCLMYLIGGNDGHHENILASGEYPVMIDLETILYPDVTIVDMSLSGNASMIAAKAFFTRSVIRTHLLPRWAADGKGKRYNGSGISLGEDGRSTVTVPDWEAVNTDAMRCVQRQKHPDVQRNTPTLAGLPVYAGRYVGQIIDGFQELYGLLQERAEDFLTAERQKELADLELRLVFRDTKTYVQVLRDFVRPKYATDGMLASVRVDMISRAMLSSENKSDLWPIVHSEHEALFQGDVPFFTFQGGAPDLHLDDGNAVPGYCLETGLDMLRKRLRGMCASDCAQQVAYVRAAFAFGLERGRTGQAPDTFPPLTRAELIAEASAIAREICDRAIVGEDGTATWISRFYDIKNEFWQVQPMGTGLYDGVGGTALFLAAAGRITGSSEFAEMAGRGFELLRRSVVHPRFQMPTVGAGTGLGSVIYSLVRGGDLLGREDLYECAVAAEAHVTPEMIASDTSLDLILGTGGLLAALLTLQERRPSDSILQAALNCGQHLLDSRAAAKNGLRAWRTSQNGLHSGYSHGAAGIAHSLERLFRATGDQKFLDAALEALEFEEALFDVQAGNWMDQPLSETGGKPVLQNRWCHGAPGIALGRLGMANSLDPEVVQRDVQRAILLLDRDPNHPIDHACCGAFGKVELLLSASECGFISDKEALHTKAVGLASYIVQRAKASSEYGLGSSDGVYIPSLFQGVAGIGYNLLRLADPGRIPAFLLWA